MLVEKREDFCIYAEDENKNYIVTEFVGDSEKSIEKLIPITIHISDEDTHNSWNNITLRMSRKSLKIFTSLLNEVVKLL